MKRLQLGKFYIIRSDLTVLVMEGDWGFAATCQQERATAFDTEDEATLALEQIRTREPNISCAIVRFPEV